MAETAIARRWLTSVLLGDVTLGALVGTRVYKAPAPPKAAEPYIVHDLLSPGEVITVINGVPWWADPLFVVYAVARADSTVDLEPVADRINALLHLGDGVATGGVVYAATRERPFDRPELDRGVLYQRLGGEYRLQVRQL